jgi:hypothetical protein
VLDGLSNQLQARDLGCFDGLPQVAYLTCRLDRKSPPPPPPPHAAFWIVYSFYTVYWRTKDHVQAPLGARVFSTGWNLNKAKDSGISVLIIGVLDDGQGSNHNSYCLQLDQTLCMYWYSCVGPQASYCAV